MQYLILVLVLLAGPSYAQAPGSPAHDLTHAGEGQSGPPGGSSVSWRSVVDFLGADLTAGSWRHGGVSFTFARQIMPSRDWSSPQDVDASPGSFDFDPGPTGGYGE